MLKKIHWLLLASSTMACSVTINAPSDDGGWFDGCGTTPGSKDAGDGDGGTSNSADASSNVADASSNVADASSGLADGSSNVADASSGLADGSSNVADASSNVADASSNVADASSNVADASSGPGSASEIEAFQRAQAAAFCGALASACGAPSGWQTEQCISTYAGGFSNVYEDLLVPGVKSGGHLAFDATRAAACLDKISHIPMPVRTATEHRAIRDACDYVIVGTVPRGGSCRANLECTSNDACIGRKDGVGTCGIIRASQLKCEFPTETKQRSNTCSYHGIGQSGFFCSSTDPNVGVCQRQAPVGYACVADFQCTSDLCAPNPAGGGNICVDRYDELAVNGTCAYFGGTATPAPTVTPAPIPAPGPAPTPIPTATATATATGTAPAPAPTPVPTATATAPDPGPAPAPTPDPVPAPAPDPVPPLVGAVTPQIIDVDGDSFVTITGVGLTAVARVTLDGAPIPFQVDSAALVYAKTPAVAAGPHTVALVSPSGTMLAATVEAWSPTELQQVHVFDARDGVARSDAAESHSWTRRTAAIAPSRNADGTTTAWTHRDGPCVVYLKNTHKYWMIGGWNTFADGPYTGWLTASTNEVWSSPDGATWTLELPHAVDPVPADRFSPRHFFGCQVLNDRLYMIGGDYTDKLQTAYHTDSWSTVDGIHWTRGADVPWAALGQNRMLHVTGTFQGKLWAFGGQNGLFEAARDVRYYNDLWSSPDGATWTKVQDNDFRDDLVDRPSGRGIISDLVEFQGRLWLVGGARAFAGTDTFFQEVWSTDGVVRPGVGLTWKKHTTPPWEGRRYAAVKVYDGKIWMISGYREGDSYNLHEVWWTADGETWHEDPAESIPWNESHADGVAVGPDGILLAGGNYTLGNTFDTQTWHLQVNHGAAVDGWSERSGALTATATGDTRPLWAEDGLNGGAALSFDVKNQFLNLDELQYQSSGRSILWVGSSPYFPNDNKGTLHAWINPRQSVISDGLWGTARAASGLEDGALTYTNYRDGEWLTTRFGEGFQKDSGEATLLGFSHATSGTLTAYSAGHAIGHADVGYADEIGWRTIGAGAGHYDKFYGMIGAAIVFDRVATDVEIEKIHQWSMGRWGVK
jgi:hypothetical protein